jgi:hypothetical protein
MEGQDTKWNAPEVLSGCGGFRELDLILAAFDLDLRCLNQLYRV